MSNDEVVKVLMQKYSLLRQEILANIANTKSHVQQFNFFLAIAGGVLPIAFGSQSKIPIAIDWTNWLIIMFIVTTVVNYFWLDIFESYFTISALAARLRSLEGLVNELAGRRLLLWETSGSEAVLWKSVPGYPNPGRVRGLFVWLLMIGVSVLLPNYVYYRLWVDNVGTGTFFLLAVMLLSAYSIILGIVSSVISHRSLNFRRPAYNIISEMVTRPWVVGEGIPGSNQHLGE